MRVGSRQRGELPPGCRLAHRIWKSSIATLTALQSCLTSIKSCLYIAIRYLAIADSTSSPQKKLLSQGEPSGRPVRWQLQLNLRRREHHQPCGAVPIDQDDAKPGKWSRAVPGRL